MMRMRLIYEEAEGMRALTPPRGACDGGRAGVVSGLGVAGEVGDLMTFVSPAMARGAVPWWGEYSASGSVFVEEPKEWV